MERWEFGAEAGKRVFVTKRNHDGTCFECGEPLTRWDLLHMLSRMGACLADELELARWVTNAKAGDRRVLDLYEADSDSINMSERTVQVGTIRIEIE